MGNQNNSPAGREHQTDRIRALVVDDDFRVAQIHATYVDQVPGFTVVGQAYTATAAADAILKLRPDLLLLDLYLPDQHGFDLLGRLRASDQRSLDVIVISAARESEDVQAALRLGAIDYLLKPFGFEVMREKLCGYARLHQQMGRLPPSLCDQDAIDSVLAVGRGQYRRDLPKGLSHQTLTLIEAALADTAEGLDARSVAELVGISRPTAQRYLAHLERAGRVEIRPRYGASGRPAHLYARVGS